jgi:Glycosyl hydrolase family 99
MTGRIVAMSLACSLAAVLCGGGPVVRAEAAVAAPPAVQSGAQTRVPLFAYYYIWFNPSSWDRAKIDLPLAGKYSSNDPAVMRKHIEWAKRAGITGFIVSWKNTPSLDRRLATLIDVAESEHFSLAMIYEGLDFSRHALPVRTIGADLQFFARTYARRSPFAGFTKPLVIWSGTWDFSADDVKRVTDPVRGQLTVLASEKNVRGYERLADAVDGDAYYWSSVNPDTFPGYATKLAGMAQAIHDRHGLWIAPAAPGFDAHAIGGTTNVPRSDGRTLLQECATAYSSSPDVIGLISWNEFSENSYIEPSVQYGTRYLDVTARCKALAAQDDPVLASDASDTTDSSSPGSGLRTGLLVAPLALVGMAWVFVVVLRRSRRRPKDDDRVKP